VQLGWKVFTPEINKKRHRCWSKRRHTGRFHFSRLEDKSQEVEEGLNNRCAARNVGVFFGVVDTEAYRTRAILQELELVLSSAGFVRNERQSHFLRFLVECQLEGRGAELKESVIAVEVFGRAPDYDPRLDAIVRTEAVRLRARLHKYYAQDGRHDSVVIELPKGGYRPLFRDRDLQKTPAQSWVRARIPASWLAGGVAILIIGMSSAALWRRHAGNDFGPVRFAIDVPPGVTLGHNAPQRGSGSAAPHFAPSPDGRRLVYVAFAADNKPQLWVRRLDGVSGQLLPGTQDATFPFWSPDSRYVAFFAEGKLKKIDPSGGTPQVICEAAAGEGGTWNRGGDIVFAPNEASGLARVSSSGGMPSPLTTLDASKAEISHRWPQFLPDGRHFLYLAMSGPVGNFLVSDAALRKTRATYVGSLDSPGRILLTRGVLRSQYSAGRLLFLRDNTLVARTFDLGSMRLTGDEIPIAERLTSNSGNGRTGFAVSDSGVLMYRRGTSVEGRRQLVWVDRHGQTIEKIGEPMNYGMFRLSPDDTQLAVYVRDKPRGLSGDLKIFSIANGTLSAPFRLAATESEAAFAWSADGTRIAYAGGNDETDLYQKAPIGGDNPERIVTSPESKEAGSWSPDGQYLAYTQMDGQTHHDIWILPLFGKRRPIPFLRTEFNEQQPAFSPDGKWIAYTSDKAGVTNVYVRPFPADNREWKIASAESQLPSWRADGKELFYFSPGSVMAVAARLDGSPEFGAPVKLFSAPISPGRFGEFAASPDGQRFLIIEQQDAAASASAVPLTVVLNWTTALAN
jgi:hypothetical protein